MDAELSILGKQSGGRGCGPNKIRRRSYTRRVTGKRVKSTCVPDKGRPGKTPKSKRVLPKLTPGKLGKYGYHDVKHKSAASRRVALTNATKEEGYAPIIRRLNVIRTYNKNSELFDLYNSDLKWMQRHLKPIYSKGATKN